MSLWGISLGEKIANHTIETIGKKEDKESKNTINMIEMIVSIGTIVEILVEDMNVVNYGVKVEVEKDNSDLRNNKDTEGIKITVINTTTIVKVNNPISKNLEISVKNSQELRKWTEMHPETTDRETNRNSTHQNLSQLEKPIRLFQNGNLRKKIFNLNQLLPERQNNQHRSQKLFKWKVSMNQMKKVLLVQVQVEEAVLVDDL